MKLSAFHCGIQSCFLSFILLQIGHLDIICIANLHTENNELFKSLGSIL